VVNLSSERDQKARGAVRSPRQGASSGRADQEPPSVDAEEGDESDPGRRTLVLQDEDSDRLDRVLLRFFPDLSRTFVQRVIKNGGVLVHGRPAKASSLVKGGQQIEVDLSAVARDTEPRPEPQDIPLRILYEDEAILILDKQAGLPIHPGPGRSRGTLVNGLVHHFDQLSLVAGESRPGIVHRLDKDTTGVLVVAKTDRDHSLISQQFERREVEKEYVAIVYGVVPFDSDYINHPIARSRFNREKMAVDPVHGKPSSTFYVVAERYDRFSVVRAHPRSGRTHQIRVHLTSIGHPIVADASYARRTNLSMSEIAPQLPELDRVLIHRQALHAHKLTFRHPRTDERVTFMAEIPDDMATVLEALRRYGRL